MGIERSSEGTTAFIDTGTGVIPVWIPRKSVDEVMSSLKDGSYVKGDSERGAIYFLSAAVKYLQAGRRELNDPVTKTAGNRQ